MCCISVIYFHAKYCLLYESLLYNYLPLTPPSSPLAPILLPPSHIIDTCGQELLRLIKEHNKKQNGGEETLLLPMSVAEGSPVHPAYPSGHSINLGAFITALKVTNYSTWC